MTIFGFYLNPAVFFTVILAAAIVVLSEIILDD